MRLRLYFLVVSLVFSLGCGNNLPHSSQISVSVSPSQATIPPNGSVTLNGTVSGFTAAPMAQWWIQESYNLDRINNRGFFTTEAPPQSGCPNGYVMYDEKMAVPSTATYYAPSAPGTYHVTFEATQFDTFDHLSKTAQATITVQ